MATRVTYTNIFSESRNNVVDLISANVTDPTISTGQSRKWIYSREPDVKDFGFKGYPFIIVNSPAVDIEDNGSSLDMKSSFINWVIEVEIITSDRGYGSSDGQGLTQIDTISNSILQAFMNKTNRQTLQANSLYFSKPKATETVPQPLQNELTFRRSIMIPFRTRMQISV